MSVVFNEGTNMSDHSSSRHKLRRCSDCGGMFVDRNENSENCGNCRQRAAQHAEVLLVGRATVGTTTSQEKPWVTPPRNAVPEDSPRDSSLADDSCEPGLPAKTQWRSPPFKIQFEETGEAESTDKFAAELPPKRFARLSKKSVLIALALLVGLSALIVRYGVPDIVRRLARRAFATSPVEQYPLSTPFPTGSGRRSTY